MARMPSSGSITSPVPETINECSWSAMASSASSRRNARSIRQSFASSTAARVRLPRYSCSLPSNFSNSVKASAVAPANPARTVSLYIRRSFFAFCFMIVVPCVTWPSEPIATWRSLRRHRIVVERMIMESLLIMRPRMRLVVGLHQPVERDVGVALGRGQRGVAEQFLDRAQVRAAVQEVGRKGMAERVRCDRREALEGLAFLRDDPLHAAGRPPPAALGAAQRSRLTLPSPHKWGEGQRVEVRPQRSHGLRPQQHDPFLSALAQRGGMPLVQR